MNDEEFDEFAGGRTDQFKPIDIERKAVSFLLVYNFFGMKFVNHIHKLPSENKKLIDLAFFYA